MFAERLTIAAATDAAGDATSYSAPRTGRVLMLQYVKDASAPLADPGSPATGPSVTVSVESTGEVLWSQAALTASKIVYPRLPVQDENGNDATLDGTRNMREAAAIFNDRLKVVIADGGDTKVGSFIAVIG